MAAEIEKRFEAGYVDEEILDGLFKLVRTTFVTVAREAAKAERQKLEAKLDRQREAMKMAERQMTSLRKNLADTELERTKAASELASLKETVKLADGQVAHLKGQLAKRTRRIDGLQKQLAQRSGGGGRT